MLGRNAGGLFWMFRYLERSENTARLVNAGFRMALTSGGSAEDEWQSILATASQDEAYLEKYDTYEPAKVIDFLLRDRSNPSSVLSVMNSARTNARMVRTNLTVEVWEATNDCWMDLNTLLARPVREKDLPEILAVIRQKSALVRGALHGTMLRNDIYNLARLGTFLERGDNTARILDVKYFVLLPSISLVGSSLDNMQWDTILRSVSALRAYGWVSNGEVGARGIADFLIFDQRLPRSIAFCVRQVVANLELLAGEYGEERPSLDLAKAQYARLTASSIDTIFDIGLHEFLESFLGDNNALAAQIERDYRFYE
ncbi:MAG: alpha-E domain-containing protein [Rhizobiales bacterium]|nr:alpha-E domain-containing protein [Hyphomicrobiales bacterium]